MIFLVIGCLSILYVTYLLYQHFYPPPDVDTNGKYVLISGCDTGFGHLLAIELDKQGFNVLAGVYSTDNATSLEDKLSPRATVFRLDITKQEDIDAALELVQSKTKVLHALVNNAGIGSGGYVDWISMETMRLIMDVNHFGHVTMTKTFLPLLIAKRDSRVVNICSVAGYLAAPGMVSYCASKYALEAFSDCLRREMIPWNLRVSIIEPGFMRTPIIENLVKPFPEFFGALSNDAQQRWGEPYIKAYHTKIDSKELTKKAEDPMKVVRALQHAVMNTAPEIRYRPGIQSSLIFFPLSMLPAAFVDYILVKMRSGDVIPSSVQSQLQD